MAINLDACEYRREDREEIFTYNGMYRDRLISLVFFTVDRQWVMITWLDITIDDTIYYYIRGDPGTHTMLYKNVNWIKVQCDEAEKAMILEWHESVYKDVLLSFLSREDNTVDQ